MKFIKKYYKLIIFALIILLIVILFLLFANKKVNYSVEYDMNGYHIKESFYKDDNMYTFNISKDNYSYDIAVDHKYSTKRKLIQEITTDVKDKYECISIRVYDKQSNTICSDGNNYYDNKLINNNDKDKSDDNFKIYNDNYDYLVWNGYGYTNKNDNKDYNFLSKESYSNNLAYRFNNYIITPDYDQNRMFNKFYIYDHDKKSISEWKINTYISFDSYFLGNIGDDLYLFDVENKIEYRMNIKKKKIKIATKKEMVIFYDKGKTTINKNKLIYNKKLFNYDNLYNFYVFDNVLYYKYYKSDKAIRLSNLNIKDIIYSDNESVYYLCDTSLYVYNINSGESKLAHSFEWNFDYQNKIYVFLR